LSFLLKRRELFLKFPYSVGARCSQDCCSPDWLSITGTPSYKMQKNLYLNGNQAHKHLILFLIQLIIFALSFWEARLPPHLPQEYDAINYHTGIPRQHLFTESLAPIPWSAADLYPLSIQFGLAPSWFISSTLHKFTQWIFAIWTFFLLLLIGRHFQKDYRGWIPAIALFTTHGVVIQLGTAMLEIVQLYFLVAAIHSFKSTPYKPMSLHLAVFSSAKAFSPFQSAFVLGGMLISSMIVNKSFARTFIKPLIQYSLLTLFLIGLLFVRSGYVSWVRAGTPFFPLGTCMFESAPGCQGTAGRNIRTVSSAILVVKDDYGTGRGPLAFM